MKTLLAFTKKECTEHLRSGRLLILAAVFTVIGVMNPATAKLTPRLLEMAAGSLPEGSVLSVPDNVTALDSWAQFFKNIPMGLAVFLLLESSIFSREYRDGTLLLSLTKGLARRKVVVAKTAVPAGVWTLCYWLCFGVTLAYTACYWDNSAARHLFFAALCWWVLGLWAVCLIVFFSALSDSNIGVLAGAGGVLLLVYLITALPGTGNFWPLRLSEGLRMVYGLAAPGDFVLPLAVTAAAAAACVVGALLLFNRKEL